MKITRTTQLYLERLELVILIGIHDFEQTRPQRVHVDVEMEVDPSDWPSPRSEPGRRLRFSCATASSSS